MIPSSWVRRRSSGAIGGPVERFDGGGVENEGVGA